MQTTSILGRNKETGQSDRKVYTRSFPTIKIINVAIISFTSPMVADQLREARLEHSFFLIDHPITQKKQIEHYQQFHLTFAFQQISKCLKRADN